MLVGGLAFGEAAFGFTGEAPDTDQLFQVDRVLDATVLNGRMVTLTSPTTLQIQRTWGRQRTGTIDLAKVLPGFEATTLRRVGRRLLIGGHHVVNESFTLVRDSYAESRAFLPADSQLLDEPLGGLDLALGEENGTRAEHYPACYSSVNFRRWSPIDVPMPYPAGGSVAWITPDGSAICEIYDEPSAQESGAPVVVDLTATTPRPEWLESNASHGQIGFTSMVDGDHKAVAFHHNQGTSVIVIEPGPSTRFEEVASTQTGEMVGKGPTEGGSEDMLFVETDEGADFSVDTRNAELIEGAQPGQRLVREPEPDLQISQ